MKVIRPEENLFPEKFHEKTEIRRMRIESWRMFISEDAPEIDDKAIYRICIGIVDRQDKLHKETRPKTILIGPIGFWYSTGYMCWGISLSDFGPGIQISHWLIFWCGWKRPYRW
jgi:hypothetical protein